MHPRLLNITELYCERDDRILFENLSFQLEQGQIIHLIGKNGSGKTSLLRILAGLYQGYEGQVEYLGQTLAEVRAAYNRALLYVGHNLSVKSGLSARENLTWYTKIQPQLDADLIDSALKKVGLQYFADVECQNLSAGQKRRVNLARLFMLPAANFANTVWILDEPFTAIDIEGVANIEEHIASYVSGGGAVILTTHQPLQMNAAVSKICLDNLGT
ncbi:MAG: cytochrome c biogenesis protein CcmA [Osedax symbiont Rs1]|nr:MAG: cytochrome c biogenesis protein CcmA [Osedax symbiont Rs1]